MHPAPSAYETVEMRRANEVIAVWADTKLIQKRKCIIMKKTHPKLRHVVPNYAVYMGLFIGTGFLSGSLVHFPLDPVRFTIIGFIGAAVFVASSTINEITVQDRKVSRAEIFKLIAFSIVLALGVGMISGGVQHFDEVPEYASILIPLGVVFSIIGYVLQHGIDLHKIQTLKLGLATVVVVAVLGISLNLYAQTFKQSASDHGEETSETHEIAPTESGAPEAPETSPDGHGH